MNKYWYFDIEKYKKRILHIERIDDSLDKVFLKNNPNLRYYCGPSIPRYPYYDRSLEIIRDCVTDREKLECGFVEKTEDLYIDSHGNFKRKDSIQKPDEILNYVLNEDTMSWVLDDDLIGLRHKLVENLYKLHVEVSNKKRLNAELSYKIYSDADIESMEQSVLFYKTLVSDIDDELRELEEKK